MSVDLENRIRHWNAGAERLLGFTAEEVIGRPVEDMNAVAGESREANERSRMFIGRTMVEGRWQMEVRRRRKDGSEVDLAAAVTPWTMDGKVVGFTPASPTSLPVRRPSASRSGRSRSSPRRSGRPDLVLGSGSPRRAAPRGRRRCIRSSAAIPAADLPPRRSCSTTSIRRTASGSPKRSRSSSTAGTGSSSTIAS